MLLMNDGISLDKTTTDQNLAQHCFCHWQQWGLENKHRDAGELLIMLCLNDFISFVTNYKHFLFPN